MLRGSGCRVGVCQGDELEHGNVPEEDRQEAPPSPDERWPRERPLTEGSQADAAPRAGPLSRSPRLPQ